MTIRERFQSFNGQYLKFSLVEHKRSNRPDIHAFLLLDSLFPYPNQEMITAATHDKIFLEPGERQLEKLTDDNIIELIRCGVRYEDGSLVMNL